MDTTTPRRLSTKDCAKGIRAKLRAAFPGVAFSVRSSTYSGGSSIRIAWTDGPRPNAVNDVAKVYEGATFDGMTDLKSHLPAREIDGELVECGADYVFTSRTVTDFDRLEQEATARILAGCMVETLANGMKRFGGDWVESLAGGMVRDADFRDADPLAGSFDRIVLRKT